MDLGLKDAHVVVVGASRGIGRAAAKRFAAEGAKVALLARNPKGLEKTAGLCREAGAAEVLIASADLSSTQQVEAAIRQAGEAWGSINVLINNAANSIGTHGTFEAIADEATYIEAFNRITLGYARSTRAALPYLKAAEWGRIVNISAVSTSNSTPLLHIYNMCKAALNSMSNANAKEFAPLGILVNLLSPGAIMVEGGNWGEVMNRYFAEAGLEPTSPYDAAKLNRIKFGGEGNWIQRHGLVDEYGAAIAFLGSRVNSYMTGANVAVDGGSNFHF